MLRSWVREPLFWLFCIGVGRSVWLLLTLTPFVAAGRRVAYGVLGLSGLLYMAPYFFIATACDFRFGWWMVVAVMAMVGLAIKGGTTEKG